MKLLALDTATENCSAALWLDGRVFAREQELGRGHAERILPMIDELRASAGIGLAQLDAIAVGLGPGGFTGVRLGVSVAQGLAFGAGLPVVGISNLAALAQRALDARPEAGGVLVCADARMGEVYTGAFRRSVDGLAEPAGDERVCPPGEVALEPVSGHWIGVGRGFRAYPELSQRLGGALAAVEADLLPDAASMLRLAARAFREGLAVEAAKLQPVYLRNDVAWPPVTSLQ